MFRLRRIPHNLSRKRNVGVRNFGAAAASESLPPGVKIEEIGFREPISVHQGWKISCSVLVDRLPLEVIRRPEFRTKWQSFEDRWLKHTKNNVNVSDDVVFMRLPLHFLKTPEQKAHEKVMTEAFGNKGASSGARTELEVEEKFHKDNFRALRDAKF